MSHPYDNYQPWRQQTPSSSTPPPIVPIQPYEPPKPLPLPPPPTYVYQPPVEQPKPADYYPGPKPEYKPERAKREVSYFVEHEASSYVESPSTYRKTKYFRTGDVSGYQAEMRKEMLEEIGILAAMITVVYGGAAAIYGCLYAFWLFVQQL